MISRVTMTNWRAYEQREFPFKEGVTFVVGQNGSGKTSLLEAIAFALTGESSLFKDAGKLVRDPNEPAAVAVEFVADGLTYVVQRSQSRKRPAAASLTRAGVDRPLVSTQKGVTAQIERLMDVSAAFLQRIVYMAEGDVFRFVSEPPVQALDGQVRRVLGLTQMDQFVLALHMADKRIEEDVQKCHELTEYLGKIGIVGRQDLERHLSEIESQRHRLLGQLGDAQSSIANRRRESEALSGALSLLLPALHLLQQHNNLWTTSQGVPLLELVDQLETLLGHADVALATIEQEAARLQGQASGLDRILDVLDAIGDNTETVPCPVCTKPMTPEDRNSSARLVHLERDSIREKISQLQKDTVNARANKNEFASMASAFRELRNYLMHMRSPQVNLTMTVGQIQEATSPTQEAGVELAAPGQHIGDLEQQISTADNERARYLIAQERLSLAGYSAPEDIREKLVALETRALSLRAAALAAQETLKAQRDSNMRSVYDQIGQVWGKFCGAGDWKVEFDRKGLPTILGDTGQQLDLAQFSGGEKTALLVILHTIVAHHFSKSDFLLIDEPLEHLDAVNRRSLVRFLVGACRRKLFSQAIVTTFEESLVRKYMSDDLVSVIHL